MNHMFTLRLNEIGPKIVVQRIKIITNCVFPQKSNIRNNCGMKITDVFYDCISRNWTDHCVHCDAV